MRNHGPRFELIPMRPHDHIGWVYSGLAELATMARPFLEEGASRGERLMLVADDPSAFEFSQLIANFDPDQLQIASIAEVYGPSRIVNSSEQQATFVSEMRTALGNGYSGIRVIADNSSLVSTPERLEAWIRWELTADRMMSHYKITGLCAFDRDRVALGALRHLSTLHPLYSAREPVPQFLLFADEGGLSIEGEIDSQAVRHLWLALDILPPKTKVTVDMTRTTLTSSRVRTSLDALAETGIDVTFVGLPETVS